MIKRSLSLISRRHLLKQDGFRKDGKIAKGISYGMRDALLSSGFIRGEVRMLIRAAGLTGGVACQRVNRVKAAK
jgi:hypothetical protein